MGGDSLQASLHFVSGPRRGDVVVLDDGECRLGRDPRNRVHISDPALSRVHCTIEVRDGTLVISDFKSLNGTFVGGKPVTRCTLEDRDLIRIGGSEIVVVKRAREKDEFSGVVLDDVEPQHVTTALLKPEDVQYPSAEDSAGAAGGRVTRDLTTLLTLSRVLVERRRTDEIEQRLVETLVDALSATYGAIVATDSDGEGLAPSMGVRREPGVQIALSRTVIRRAVQQQSGVLHNPDLGENDLEDAPSVMQGDMRSIICAPLTVSGRVLGVVYLVLRKAPGFDHADLQLVVGAANMAALALDNASRVENLEAEAARLRSALKLDQKLVGTSALMQAVHGRIAKLAVADSVVLIRGESGTGKELAARAIHDGSRRAAKPFVAVNCAALAEHLLESELFGHERGAFTGAVTRKPGKFELANGGTLFLDELGELTPLHQAKLLRVLQERVFERLGGTTLIKVDVRVIAATNRDLEEAMRSGGFREDLFFRLNVVTLTMPPLRERREDIRLLAGLFVERLRGEYGRRVSGLSPEAFSVLESYRWPGNVRELQNAIVHAGVFGSTDLILPEDLPEVILEQSGGRSEPVGSYHEAVDESKRQIIIKAIQEAGGNYRGAARLLDLNPTYLHRLMKTLDVKRRLGTGDR